MLTLDPSQLSPQELVYWQLLEALNAYSESMATAHPLPQPPYTAAEILEARRWQAAKLLPAIEQLSYRVQHQETVWFEDLPERVQESLCRRVALQLAEQGFAISPVQLRTVYQQLEARFVHDRQKNAYRLREEDQPAFYQYLKFLT